MCKKKKIHVTEVECNNFECKGSGIFWYTGNLPELCPYGHRLLHDTAKPKTINYKDKDDFDLEKGGCYSPRPSWDKGRQNEILERARSPGGTIYCQICGEEIEVNIDGKEEWESRSGKLHQTLPHTDHYYSPSRGIGGDWIERKRKVRKDPKHLKLPENKRRKVEKEIFNASPLRVAHMMCNCSRSKN